MEMEKIQLSCASCSAKLAVPGTAAGKMIRCPKCGATVTVEDPGGGQELDFRDPAPVPPSLAPPGIDAPEAGPAGGPPSPEARAAGSGRVLTTIPDPHQRPRKGFARSLDTVFFYPFNSFGSALFLLLMSPLWAMVWAFGGCLMWVPRIILGGYIGAYMFSILFNTSMGKATAPGSPNLMDFGEVFGYFFRFFGAWFVSYGPLIGLVIYGIFGTGLEVFGNSTFLALLVVAGIFGTVYSPMALMIIGFAESWFAGFNYVLGIRSILRIPVDYLLCVLFFIATNVVYFLLQFFWVSTTEGLGGALVALFVTNAALFYLYAVQMRALGLLYLTNKEQLGWFR